LGPDYQRLIEKEHKPTETEIMNFVGKPANEAWMELKRFLGRNYDIVPEMMFGARYQNELVRFRLLRFSSYVLMPKRLASPNAESARDFRKAN
jgi:hypothetical protein